MRFPKPPPRERLKPWQRARSPIRKLGRIGLQWKDFQQRVLEAWWSTASAFAASHWQRGSWDCLEVKRAALPDEAATGWIGRRVRMDGRLEYKGFGIQVGHRPGVGRDRRPDLRHSILAVEPQSEQYNAHLERIAQPKCQRDRLPEWRAA